MRHKSLLVTKVFVLTCTLNISMADNLFKFNIQVIGSKQCMTVNTNQQDSTSKVIQTNCVTTGSDTNQLWTFVQNDQNEPEKLSICSISTSQCLKINSDQSLSLSAPDKTTQVFLPSIISSQKPSLTNANPINAFNYILYVPDSSQCLGLQTAGGTDKTAQAFKMESCHNFRTQQFKLIVAANQNPSSAENPQENTHGFSQIDNSGQFCPGHQNTPGNTDTNPPSGNSDTPGSTSNPGDAVSNGSFSTEKKLCLDLNNQYRATKGLTPLTWSTALEQFADEGAKSDISTNKAHGHFGEKGSNLFSQGFRGIAENAIPAWPLSGSTVSNIIRDGIKMMWNEGPGGGHYENMVGNYTQVGCGISVVNGRVWVDIDFGSK